MQTKKGCTQCREQLTGSLDSVCGFVFPLLAADPAGLHQHERQGPSGINPAVALAAAYWILQQ
jgi:hypothetical protein